MRDVISEARDLEERGEDRGKLDRVKKAVKSVKLQNGVSVRRSRTFLRGCKQTASGRYTLSTHCYSSIES